MGSTRVFEGVLGYILNPNRASLGPNKVIGPGEPGT